MKKLLFCLILIYSLNAYSIPHQYDSEIKQFIYNKLKDISYKQQILDKMRSLSYYFSIRGNNYAADKINVTIYYIEMFDIENLSEEQQKVVLFFIKHD